MDNNENIMAMTPETTEICRRIRQIRKMKKLSQKDFAASVGMSQGHLCVIERQERPPSVTLLKAICHEYRINPDWLRSGDGEQFTSTVANGGIPVFDHLRENYPEDTKEQDIIGRMALPGLPKGGFALYQRGDYMTPTIHARDLVVCDPAGAIVNDDLVLVKNRWGTWIVRRFRKVDDRIVLTPDNPAYQSFEYGEDEKQLLVKISQVLRNVNF